MSSNIRFLVEGKGEPVTLIHGVGSNLESWDHVVQRLKADFTVLRMDLRGQGRSKRITRDCTLEDFVDDVLDATGTSAELGKTAGQDAKQRKANFVSMLGVEGAQQAAQERYRRAVDHLGAIHVDCTLLKGLAQYVISRTA